MAVQTRFRLLTRFTGVGLGLVVVAGLTALVFQTWSTPAVAQVGAADGTAFSEYSGALEESQVVPTRTNSSTSGDITVGLDQVTNTVDVHLHLTGINRADVTAIQLRQGRAGTNGTTVVLALDLARLEEDDTGALEWARAMIPIPANRVDALRTGNVYVVVGTRAFPAGEIRGQLTLDEDDDNFDLTGMPDSLSSVSIPTANLTNYVRDMNKAKILGKALFWDMQLGSDGRTACATCHFHAGADMRTRNAIGLPPHPLDQHLRVPNGNAARSDFPFHRLSNVRDRDSTVLFDTAEVCGSAGVLKKRFTAVTTGSAVDQGVNVLSPDFCINGTNVRQVEPRNTPTVINAVFNDRQFWDGRANRFFNGVNPFGDQDPTAKVWQWNGVSTSPAVRVGILIDNGSLASQAVGPPLSDFEMSWGGRSFSALGRKMLSLRPLALQTVHAQDSVLGSLANRSGKGLVSTVTYRQLISEAFHDRWWRKPGTVDGTYSQMEANFSLFFGLAIQIYEATLVSDDSRFDKFARGQIDLTNQEKEGLELFLKQGRCINCHSGPEFTSATVQHVRPEPIEFMAPEHGPAGFYDAGFYNIGVRPEAEDPGLKAGVTIAGVFKPFSRARRLQLRQPVDVSGVTISAGDRVIDSGSFKTPSLRNIELTGPYFHNGGVATLEGVIEFYARGTDFFDNPDLDPDVGGIGKVRGNSERIAAMVAFLKTLTDERVRYRRAPFDHPELIVPNGHVQAVPIPGMPATDSNVTIPAVGMTGGTPLKSFVQTLTDGGFR